MASTKDKESSGAATVGMKSASTTGVLPNRGRKRLSKKQKGFIKDYIETGNGVESALKNYDTKDYNTANAIAVENLQKPAIVNALHEALSDDVLKKVHLEGLQAKSFRYSPEGELIQTDDFATRSKYLDLAYKIRGSFAAEKRVNVTIEVNEEERNKILGITTEVIGKMTNEEVCD